MISVCDGEKNYFLFKKAEYTKKQAIKEARRIIKGDIDISYADEMKYGQYYICRKQGDYYCISEKG